MRFLFTAGFCLMLTAFSTGCCSGRLENASGDLIDTLTERKLYLEFLYKPGLDLSRIGKPDWCRSPLNRLICREKCCGSYGNSCQSDCCQAETSCDPLSPCRCSSTGNQVFTAEGVAEKNVPVLESTWESKTVPSLEATFEELPSPKEKKGKQATQ